MRAVVGAITIAVVAAACSAGPRISSTPAPTGLASASAIATALASRPAPTVEAPSLLLVGIGDSLAAAQICRCARYPEAYGALASVALGEAVRVQNLAVVGITSADLLHAIDSSLSMQSALGEADIVTLSIGINDTNPCQLALDLACYDGAIAGLKVNLETILTRIDTLQGSHPHLVRGTGYYNSAIGSPFLAQSGASFQTFVAARLTTLNATICAAIVAHLGLCVPLLVAFNGPAGDQDAGSLLVADHVHPSLTGNQAIAAALDAAGYAPLSP